MDKQTKTPQDHQHKSFKVEEVISTGLKDKVVTLDIFALSILNDKVNTISNILGNGIIKVVINEGTINGLADSEMKSFDSQLSDLVNNVDNILEFINKITGDYKPIEDISNELFGVEGDLNKLTRMKEDSSNDKHKSKTDELYDY